MAGAAMRKSATPTRSPNREALATAIAEHLRAKREMETLRSAVTRAEAIKFDAESKLDEAKAKVAEAKDAAARRVTLAARDGENVAGAHDLTLREARIAEANAQDDFDAAVAALAGFKDALQFPKRYDGVTLDPVTVSEAAVNTAARAVLSEEIDVPHMVAEAEAAFAMASAKRGALVHLVRLGLVSEEHGSLLHMMNNSSIPRVWAAKRYSDSADKFHWELAAIWPDINTEHDRPPEDLSRAVASWNAALQALATNADAELPQ